LQVGGLDCKRHLLTLVGAFYLEWCSRPDRSIEGDIVRFAIGRASLDIAAALPFGIGARAAASAPAGQLVESRVELARVERLADFDFIAAVPPMGIAGIEDTLCRWALWALFPRCFFNSRDLLYVFFFYPESGALRVRVLVRLRFEFRLAIVRYVLASRLG
jgi:hypothetical protein